MDQQEGPHLWLLSSSLPLPISANPPESYLIFKLRFHFFIFILEFRVFAVIITFGGLVSLLAFNILAVFGENCCSCANSHLDILFPLRYCGCLARISLSNSVLRRRLARIRFVVFALRLPYGT